MQRLSLLAFLCLWAALAAMLSFLLAAATAPMAYAGGWTSGGGELLESSANPWFIQSGGTQKKRIVFYCVDVDEVNFGVTRRDATRLIDQTFTFWMDEFIAAEIPGNPTGNRVHVARETFIPKPTCTPEVPLRFQLGVLDEEQLTEFDRHGQDPRKLVAVAVRRDYDEASLQTRRGFIYIAPPTGPLAMVGRDLASHPWSSDSHSRLALILRHELGHVFGLAHDGSHRRIMGGGFPENLVSKNAMLYYPMLDSVFKVPLGVALGGLCYSERYPMPARLRDYFSIPSAYFCAAPQMQSDRIELVAWNPDDWDHKVVIGTAMLDAPVVTQKIPLVRLWLPDAQAVYRNVPDFLGKILNGPTVVKTQRTGTYRPSRAASGEVERELMVDIAPERVQISGVLDGKIQINLLSYPPF